MTFRLKIQSDQYKQLLTIQLSHVFPILSTTKRNEFYHRDITSIQTSIICDSYYNKIRTSIRTSNISI